MSFSHPNVLIHEKHMTQGFIPSKRPINVYCYYVLKVKRFIRKLFFRIS